MRKPWRLILLWGLEGVVNTGIRKWASSKDLPRWCHLFQPFLSCHELLFDSFSPPSATRCARAAHAYCSRILLGGRRGLCARVSVLPCVCGETMTTTSSVFSQTCRIVSNLVWSAACDRTLDAPRSWQVYRFKGWAPCFLHFFLRISAMKVMMFCVCFEDKVWSFWIYVACKASYGGLFTLLSVFVRICIQALSFSLISLSLSSDMLSCI